MFADTSKEAYSQRQYKFFVDNFFTGLPLLRFMTDYRYGFTGTVRENIRNRKLPFEENSMKKAAWGSITSYTNSSKDLVVVQWKDNSIVQVASNCYSVRPIKSACRHSAAEKKRISVDMPRALQKYSSQMGETDLIDRNIVNYPIKLRNNKW